MQGAALPPAVQGSRPPTSRWYVFRRRRGDEPQPYRGRRCRRRCRVPALPRPVVGVSAGGGGQAPALQGAALPPAGWGWAPALH